MVDRALRTLRGDEYRSERLLNDAAMAPDILELAREWEIDVVGGKLLGRGVVPDQDTIGQIMLLRREERYQELYEFVEPLFKQSPQSSFYAFICGDTLSGLGRHSEALVNVDVALSIDPTNVGARMLRGGILTNLQRLSEAISNYEMVLEIEPGNVSLLMLRGYLLEAVGQPYDALESFVDARRAAPQNTDILMCCASAYHSLGRHDEALDCYDSVLAIEQANLPAFVGRAEVLAYLDRFEPALADYDKSGSD